MRKKILEEKIIFFSILKWTILSLFTGCVVGACTSLFLRGIDYGIKLRKFVPFGYYFLLPIGLILSVFLIQTFAKDAEGHGTEKVIEAIHKKNGKINIMVVPIKVLATIITIVFGGSVGKEGPSAQIGGAMMSFFSDLLKINQADKKKLVICGIAAGFGAVFGTPVAGAVFAVEVLFVGRMLYTVLFPSFIASFTSIYVSELFKINKPNYVKLKIADNLTLELYLKVFIAAIIFAVVTFIFIEVLEKIEGISKHSKLNIYLKAVLASIVVIIIGYFFSDSYLGLGLKTMDGAILGEKVSWYAPFLKIFTTSMTLSFGGSGGILTPVFFIGSTIGNVTGKLLHGSIPLFAALGMVSVLSGAANTPIAAVLMATELFGAEITPLAILSCIITFLLTGHRSVYPTQILSMKKSASIDLEIGKEIKDTRVLGTTKKIERIKRAIMRNEIYKLIPLENIFFSEASSREEIFKEFSLRMSKVKKQLKAKDIEKALFERENKFSTALGHDIAIPHFDVSLNEDFFILFAVLKEEIEWDDINKVKIVIMIARPDFNQKIYLDIVSRTLKILNDNDIASKILNSNSKDTIFNIIKEKSHL